MLLDGFYLFDSFDGSGTANAPVADLCECIGATVAYGWLA